MPDCEGQLIKVKTDSHRLRAAFIRGYCELHSENKISPLRQREISREYDIRRYAIYMDSQTLSDRIYARTVAILSNPLLYKEIGSICHECLLRSHHKLPSLNALKIFTQIGLSEGIHFLAHLPSVAHNARKQKELVRRFFREVMTSTR